MLEMNNKNSPRSWSKSSWFQWCSLRKESKLVQLTLVIILQFRMVLTSSWMSHHHKRCQTFQPIKTWLQVTKLPMPATSCSSSCNSKSSSSQMSSHKVRYISQSPCLPQTLQTFCNLKPKEAKSLAKEVPCKDKTSEDNWVSSKTILTMVSRRNNKVKTHSTVIKRLSFWRINSICSSEQTASSKTRTKLSSNTVKLSRRSQMTFRWSVLIEESNQVLMRTCPLSTLDRKLSLLTSQTRQISRCLSRVSWERQITLNKETVIFVRLCSKATSKAPTTNTKVPPPSSDSRHKSKRTCSPNNSPKWKTRSCAP